ncbi:MAG: peptidoglycan DD-metalloendopeptidase family protein [Bacillota bacterium]
MRRRERLTGFFIIFILLVFSAYSNSMNVGGRSKSIDTNFLKIEENSENGVKLEQNMSPELNSKLKIKSEKELTERKNDKTELKPKKAVSVFPTDQPQEKKGNDKLKVFGERKTQTMMKQIKVHQVKKGETLWDIAHQHDLNIDTLIGANNISNMNSIKPGQEFKILPVKGIIYRVSPGESLSSISRKFNLEKEKVMEDNNIEDPAKLKIDQKLILRGAKPEFSYQDRLDQKFMYPIDSRITSYYGKRWGRMHEGIDFAAPMGSPIRAVSSGRVVYSGWATGYGYVVIIEHQKGLRTLYAHNSKLLVKTGESVAKGEVISRSGNTGNSTGPHLHLEVQVNGRPENPLNYINK